MPMLEHEIEKRLIDQLCCDESQWTYRPDITTEDQLWANFKYILEQNNKARLNDTPLSESEFAKIRNDLSHASFYDAGKWLVEKQERGVTRARACDFETPAFTAGAAHGFRFADVRNFEFLE